MSDQKKIWGCKIGETDPENVPRGGDGPMREAVAVAYQKLTGESPHFIFSGWGARLTEGERAAHEDRLPSTTHAVAWEGLRAMATELKQRDGEQWAMGDLLEDLLGLNQIRIEDNR